MSSTSLLDRVRVELKARARMVACFFLFFFPQLKFAEWESIDRDEIIDRMKVEQEAMTRALMIVSSLPSGSLLTVARSLIGWKSSKS